MLKPLSKGGTQFGETLTIGGQVGCNPDKFFRGVRDQVRQAKVGELADSAAADAGVAELVTTGTPIQ